VKAALTWLALVCAACAGAAPPALAPPVTDSDEGWRGAIPPAGEPSRIDYPVPRTERLDSGLSLWAVERPARVASITLVVRHGASSLPAGKSGLAALTARMLTESTRERSSLELAEAVESLGTTLVHDASRDTSMVGMTVLSSDLERACDLLAEVALRPRFDAEELERVRGEWLDGLRAERQNPNRLASLAGLRRLYGEPHGAPVGGGIGDVQRLTTSDVIAFHREAWRPESAALVVVGEPDPARVRRAVERAFGRWKAAAVEQPFFASPPPLPDPPVRDKPLVVLIDRPGSVQTALFAVHPLPRRSEPGFEARQILNSVVGGLFTSRLNQNLREKHAYTYGARSQAIATRHWGAFAVSTSVETAVTAPALRELLTELRQARDPRSGRPIAGDELARAKADLASSLGAHLEQVDSVSRDMTALFGLELGADYYSRYPALLAAVSRDEVQAEAATRLMPDQLVIVVVGDATAIEGDLAALGVSVERPGAELVD
jgi:zinc protease